MICLYNTHRVYCTDLAIGGKTKQLIYTKLTVAMFNGLRSCYGHGVTSAADGCCDQTTLSSSVFNILFKVATK